MIDSQPWQVQIINSKLDLSSKIAHLWTHWFPVVDSVLWSILNNWAYHKCLFVRHSSTFAFVLPIWTPILEFLFRYGRFKIFIQVQPKSELNVDWSELDRPLPMQHFASPDSLDYSIGRTVRGAHGSSLENKKYVDSTWETLHMVTCISLGNINMYLAVAVHKSTVN